MLGLARFAGSSKRETKAIAAASRGKVTPLSAAVLARRLHSRQNDSSLRELTQFIKQLPITTVEVGPTYSLWAAPRLATV